MVYHGFKAELYHIMVAAPIPVVYEETCAQNCENGAEMAGFEGAVGPNDGQRG